MNVRLKLRTFALGLLLTLPLAYSHAFPLSGDETVLPPGTELNEDALARPREVFRSEVIGGRKSYLVNLGDVAFNSPSILGGAARQAAMSCGTCHVNGAIQGSSFPACPRVREISTPQACRSIRKPSTAFSILSGFRAYEGHAISPPTGMMVASRH